jgi:hypothetical protein
MVRGGTDSEVDGDDVGGLGSVLEGCACDLEGFGSELEGFWM